ncbi:MAG: OmpA family protein [Gammaproteobacteria bacterium]|nr:MAG: OmpA family protein [Gammaproteobacteria bacterium]
MRTRLLACLVITGLLAGCAADDPDRRAKTGAAVGAIAGAVIGHQIDHDKGRFIGAAVGAIAGGMTGHYMDEQERAFKRELEEEQRRHEIEIERLKDDTLKLNLNSEVSFDFDSARIKPAFRDTLDKLAGIIRKYDRTVVHIVGHTDSIGPADYNQRLSERRARAVYDYLVSRGVDPARLRWEGRGESEPRASNATEAGRQLNRRVEIYIKPVVEGQEEKAWTSPRY